jgi:hypothetical protein
VEPERMRSREHGNEIKLLDTLRGGMYRWT